MEAAQVETRRMRVNVSETAKGLAQLDITVEFETSDGNKRPDEECAAMLAAAFDRTRTVLAEKGIKEVSA